MHNISGSITTGDTAQTLTADSNINFLSVQNISNGDLWLMEGGAAATKDQPSMKLPAGTILELLGDAADGPWSIIGATTGQKFVARQL